MTRSASRIATILFCVSAVSTALIIFIVLRHNLTNDLALVFRGWFTQLTQRGLPAISGEYSIYPPTYLYLLATVAPLHPVMSDVVLIKSVSMAFSFVAGCIVSLIVFEITMNKNISAVAGSGFLIIPTVITNSAYWGQNDIIYSTFILGFVLFNLKGDPRKAVLCLGLAFSLKLQTIFVAPYALYLILRRRIAVKHVLIVPIVYVAAMFPAWLMGRPASQLVTIYLG